MNSGKYIHPIEIWRDEPGTEEDELGNKKSVPTKVGNTFAEFKSLVGSLLIGRAAETVVSKSTCKFCWPYFNFPEVIPGVHYIKYRGKSFNIDLSLNNDFKNEELQVFCNELI